MKFKPKLALSTLLADFRVIVKEQADIIRFLFTEYSLGKSSLSSLANVLDSKGIKGFDGKYASYTVKNILKNKHYLGEDIYPQIIDKELFDKVQDIMFSKAGNKNKAKTNAVIAYGRGLLYDNGKLLSTNTFDKRYVLRDGTSYVYQLSFKPVDKIIIYASKIYYARYYQMIAHSSNTELKKTDRRILQVYGEIQRENIFFGITKRQGFQSIY